MGIVFCVRGSLTARYNNGLPNGTALGNAAPTVAADAGALSGNSIQWAANNNIKAVSWSARNNSPNGRAISVLTRYRPGYTGTPSSTHSLWSLIAGCGKVSGLELEHNSSTGILAVTARNEGNVLCMNVASFGAWSPTSGTWYDLVFTWDGTTGANSATVYVDAVSNGTVTPTAAFTASWTNQYFTEFNLGTGNVGGIINGGRMDEIVIWDSVITPSSVTLDSGTGSLNGASRSSLVARTALDGSSYTDPGIANVKTGVSYTQAGVSETGTYDGSDRWTDPGSSNVKTGVAYKANSTSNNETGSYDGSDRWTAPTAPQLLTGVQLKNNSTSLNLTGTLIPPGNKNANGGS